MVVMRANTVALSSLCGNSAQELEQSLGRIVFEWSFSGYTKGEDTPLISGVNVSQVLRVGVAVSCKYLLALELANHVLLDIHIVII